MSGTIGAPNWQFRSNSPYHVTDRGTIAMGVRNIEGVHEGFEDADLDLTIVGTWSRSTTAAHQGEWSFRAAPIGDPGFTDAQVTIPNGATRTTFWYKVSSELDFDFFRVFVGATEVITVSGEVGWTEATLDVTGETFLTFRYEKDSFATEGEDTAWVDDVCFDGPSSYTPIAVDCSGRIITTLDGGSTAISGIIDTRELDCLTDSVTICPGDDPIIVEIEGVTPVSGAIPVTFEGSISVGLDCDTDSVTTCDAPAAFAGLSVANDDDISVTLSAANTDRIGWYCFNDSTEILFIKFGVGATRTDCNIMVSCGGLYEMPHPIYQGIITGVWTADTTGGVARVTELT